LVRPPPFRVERTTVKKVIEGSEGPLPVVTIDAYPDSWTLPEA
jgi:hypothetical protein